MTNGTIVSLFSGAGGLDMGFIQAGYDVVFATDINEDVKPTYDTFQIYKGSILTSVPVHKSVLRRISNL